MNWCKKHMGPYPEVAPLPPSRVDGKPAEYRGNYHLVWGVNPIPEDRKANLEIGVYHLAMSGSGGYVFFDGDRFHYQSNWRGLESELGKTLEWDCEECNEWVDKDRYRDHDYHYIPRPGVVK